jgi:flavin-dependent dehydrogenase
MTTHSLVIVGAGIGGLTAAITAAERGLDVTLVEAGDKVGDACHHAARSAISCCRS